MIYISGGLQEHIYINIHQTILNICILYIIAQFKNGEEDFSGVWITEVTVRKGIKGR